MSEAETGRKGQGERNTTAAALREVVGNPEDLYLDLITLIIISGRNRAKALIGSGAHKIVVINLLID